MAGSPGSGRWEHETAAGRHDHELRARAGAPREYSKAGPGRDYWIKEIREWPAAGFVGGQLSYPTFLSSSTRLRQPLVECLRCRSHASTSFSGRGHQGSAIPPLGNGGRTGHPRDCLLGCDRCECGSAASRAGVLAGGCSSPSLRRWHSEQVAKGLERELHVRSRSLRIESAPTGLAGVRSARRQDAHRIMTSIKAPRVRMRQAILETLRGKTCRAAKSSFVTPSGPPFGAYGGSLKSTPATALGSTVVKAVLERAKLECCED